MMNVMIGQSFIRHAAFTWGNVAVLVAALGLLVWNVSAGHLDDALVWVAVSGFTVVILQVRGKLPPLFGFCLAVVAAANSAGYTMTLWHEGTAFDETVHALTTFAGTAALGWGLLSAGKLPRSRARLVTIVIGLGVLLGLLWEGIEWLIGIIGNPRDTAIDLVMDALGASMAAALVSRVQSSGERR